MFIGACALAGIDFLAKAKWKAAVEVANKLYDEDNNDPKEYMEEIGSTPRVTVSPGGLIQIYRWTGSLRTYDLRLFFHGGDGAYVLSELDPVYHPADLSKMQLAKATGTLDDKLAENSSPDETNPMSAMGGGGGAGFGGGGQESGGPGVGFQGFNDSNLKMDMDIQDKWDNAVKQLNEAIADLPEDRREAFTKRRELQQKFREEAKGYLSEEQHATFEKNNPVRQSRGRGGISADQLGLKGDAKTKYESAAGKLSEEMRTMFTGGTGGSREELREKMTVMRDKFESELKTILDEDQLKKYQELRNQQRQRRGGFRGPGGGGTQSPSPKGNNSKATKTSPKGN